VSSTNGGYRYTSNVLISNIKELNYMAMAAGVAQGSAIPVVVETDTWGFRVINHNRNIYSAGAASGNPGAR